MIPGLFLSRADDLKEAVKRAIVSRDLPAPFGHVRLADGTVFAPGEKRHLLSREGIEEFETMLLNVDGATSGERLDLKHRFAPGIYIREIFMPAGEYIIGAEHTTEHFNTVLSGRATVIMAGTVYDIAGPETFISGAGVRKVLWIHEDMRWQTIHPNPDNERDTGKLEARLCRMSESYIRHFKGMKTLQQAMFNGRSPQ